MAAPDGGCHLLPPLTRGRGTRWGCSWAGGDAAGMGWRCSWAGDAAGLGCCLIFLCSKKLRQHGRGIFCIFQGLRQKSFFKIAASIKYSLFYSANFKWGMCSSPLAVVFELPSSWCAAGQALGMQSFSEKHSGQNLVLFWHKKVARNQMYFCCVRARYFYSNHFTGCAFLRGSTGSFPICVLKAARYFYNI